MLRAQTLKAKSSYNISGQQWPAIQGPGAAVHGPGQQNKFGSRSEK